MRQDVSRRIQEDTRYTPSLSRQFQSIFSVVDDIYRRFPFSFLFVFVSRRYLWEVGLTLLGFEFVIMGCLGRL